jgi:rhomboid protease GluP
MIRDVLMASDLPTQTGSPESQAPRSNPQIVVSFPIVDPYLTYLLLLILGTIQVYALNLDDIQQNRFYFDYILISNRVTAGEFYRLFTSMFLHSSSEISHIIFNGLALYAFGKDIESLFGHMRFTLIYLLGGIAGSLISYIITQGASVGASGAVFALFGALMVYFFRNRHLYRNAYEQLRHLLILAIVNFALGFWINSQDASFKIDNAGHLGGLVGGIVLAWFICPIFQIEEHQTLGNQTEYHAIDRNQLRNWIIAPTVFVIWLTITTVLVASIRRAG